MNSSKFVYKVYFKVFSGNRSRALSKKIIKSTIIKIWAESNKNEKRQLFHLAYPLLIFYNKIEYQIRKYKSGME
ncbi:MAG: hypothetical protein ACTHLL_04420 [Candidatus Nitrosocosmicus sp.]